MKLPAIAFFSIAASSVQVLTSPIAFADDNSDIKTKNKIEKPTYASPLWRGVGVHDGEQLDMVTQSEVVDESGAAREGMNVGWYYDWHANDEKISGDAKYIPMVWCEMDPQTFAQKVELNPSKDWLIFNEPDIAQQCGISPDEAAARYKHLYEARQKSTVGSLQPIGRMLVGGTIHLPSISLFNIRKLKQELLVDTLSAEERRGIENTIRLCKGNLDSPQDSQRASEWWDDFLDANGETPIEGVHLHAYGTGIFSGSSFQGFSTNQCNQWKTRGRQVVYDDSLANCLTDALEKAYCYFQTRPETRGKPIWITETGLLGNQAVFESLQVRLNTIQPNVARNLMQPLINWQEENVNGGKYHLFERMAWFSNATPADAEEHNIHPFSDLISPDRTLSPLGELWKSPAKVNDINKNLP